MNLIKCTLFFFLLSTVLSTENITDSEECYTSTPFNCSSGELIDREKFCDVTPDCSDGSDEIVYNHSIHKNWDLECFGKKKSTICALPNDLLCDGVIDCEFGTDECGCDKSMVCKDSIFGACFPRVNFCDNKGDCVGHTDEIKYRPGIPGFQCPVSKLRSTFTCMLPMIHVCDGIPDCDDGTDECFCHSNTSYSNDHCFRCLDGSLVIPIKKLCDNVFHCQDLSDECLCLKKPDICEQIKGHGTCGNGKIACQIEDVNVPPTCINKTNVCDGRYDCPNQEDELNCVVDASGNFTCSKGEQYIPMYQRCDNHTDCKDGSDEVSCGDQFFECNEFYPQDPDAVDNRKGGSCGCGKKSNTSCWPFGQEIRYKLLVVVATSKVSVQARNPNLCPPDTVMDGARSYDFSRPRYTTPCDKIPKCEDLEDECNKTLCGDNVPEYCDKLDGRCGFICAATKIALIGTQVCDGYPHCTLDDPPNSNDEWNCTDRFYCKDRGKDSLPIHIPQSAECNNVSDCHDHSDELSCSNKTHHYCKSRVPKYLPISKVCNGVQDCKDGKDECQQCTSSPFSSDEFLINSYVLQVFIWIIGLFAAFGNIGVLLHNCHQFISNKNALSAVAYNHRILVTNLALADLLLGIYLISLGVVNSTYKGVYCEKDIQWRASKSCSAIGSIAVISVQCSVLLLAIMTSMRVFLVTRPVATISQRRYIFGAIVFAWVYAFILALTPLSESQIDYFVSELWYSNNPFLTLVSRNDMESFTASLRTLNGSLNGWISDRSPTWADMIKEVSQLNETYVPDLYFGYYSAHGVCLPRIFPNSSVDRSWGFSLLLITINFVIFIYMLCAYIVIYSITTKQSRRAGSATGGENETVLQRKITRIILTNFCCWIPICIMAFVSAGGNKVSDEAYAVSAIILLPINSAFNPFLYSDLPDLIWEKVFADTSFGKWVESQQLASLKKRKTSLQTGQATKVTDDNLPVRQSMESQDMSRF